MTAENESVEEANLPEIDDNFQDIDIAESLEPQIISCQDVESQCNSDDEPNLYCDKKTISYEDLKTALNACKRHSVTEIADKMNVHSSTLEDKLKTMKNLIPKDAPCHFCDADQDLDKDVSAYETLDISGIITSQTRDFHMLKHSLTQSRHASEQNTSSLLSISEPPNSTSTPKSSKNSLDASNLPNPEIASSVRDLLCFF